MAATLLLCTDEIGRMPLFGPDGNGSADLLIQRASRELGVRLAYLPAPTARCQRELRSQQVDGYPATPYTPTVTSLLVFPTRAGRPDASRAVGSARTMVYRRVGSAVGWDGRRFTGLRTAVIVPAGSVMLLDRIAAMKLPVDAGAKTLDAGFAKLLRGRADVVLGWEGVAAPLLARPPFAGELEALPQPFADEHYHLTFTHQFYRDNKQLAERLWQVIARLRREQERGARPARPIPASAIDRRTPR